MLGWLFPYCESSLGIRSSLDYCCVILFFMFCYCFWCGGCYLFLLSVVWSVCSR